MSIARAHIARARLNWVAAYAHQRVGFGVRGRVRAFKAATCRRSPKPFRGQITAGEQELSPEFT
jgi:hypothetical protein